MKIEIAGRTDPGCMRANNEDNWIIDEEIGLLVVADGMGGHNSGEVASLLATQTILENARKLAAGKERPAELNGDASNSRMKQLEYIIQVANKAIFDKSSQGLKDKGMGTTVVAAIIDRGVLTVGHVGDSRLYLFRNGHLEALTQDHSLVADQVRRGMITPEEAQSSSFQNILTRALGTESEVAVDVDEHPLVSGDVVLLCTDGLTKMVPEPEIEKALSEGGAPPAICKRLIEMAIDAGGADNVTTIAARIPEGSGGGVRGFLQRIFGRG